MKNPSLALTFTLPLLSLVVAQAAAQIPVRTVVASGLTAIDAAGNRTVSHFPANQQLSSQAARESINSAFSLRTEIARLTNSGTAEVVISIHGETTAGSAVRVIQTSTDANGTQGPQRYELAFTVSKDQAAILDVHQMYALSPAGPVSVRLTGPGVNLTGKKDNIIFAKPGPVRLQLELDAVLVVPATGGRVTMGAYFNATLRYEGSEVSYGTGCNGARLGSVGILDSRGSYAVRVDSLPPGSSPLLIASADNGRYAGLALPLNLTPFGWPGCSLLVGGDLLMLPMPVIGSTAQLSLPLRPRHSSYPIYLQGLILSPGSTPSLATTQGLEITWRH